MRINSKGQVTIPADLREKYGITEGDEVDVIEVGNTLTIVRREGSESRGQRLVRRMRGAATTKMSTDEIMRLFRGDDWDQ
ncbi:AbrB/MazE/SpoVT family DNA-binding domain-containing protein [Planomonospora venezuelensis]|uniref:AbrB family looped-hinge helix DNA binding protein n=1 Tax=Planomonospora venezuelensis TaxID=1999 RepID=A0A841DD59_PLAVE|nr:AbrB/MazE/SpoVT family DNA-binding domain-containing protein [Planomonospora venezuelensis]MBB5966757.1 AbrB family looped-hinge helix DNA binding protein [Planomonospora venezuelensis]